MLRKAFVFFCVVFALMTVVDVATAKDGQTDGLRPHLAFNLGSHHLNASRDFNEFNPGIGIGQPGPIGTGTSQLGVEAGQYKNSLGDQSYYLMASFDAQIASITPNVALRMGGFSGFARYKGTANKFKNHGVPTIGDWVLAVGLQTTLRVADTYDLRLRVMPAGNVADALFTALMAVRF